MSKNAQQTLDRILNTKMPPGLTSAPRRPVTPVPTPDPPEAKRFMPLDPETAVILRFDPSTLLVTQVETAPPPVPVDDCFRTTAKVKPLTDKYGRDIKQALKMLSGKMVWPLDFRPDDLDLDDVVLGISRANRFLGQTRIPINVCWHSLNLSLLIPKHLALHALVHDMTEAYLMDIPRPLKNHPMFAFFKSAEDKLFSQMCEALNLPFRTLPEEFNQYDADIGTAEMSLYNPRGYAELRRQGFPKERHEVAKKLAVRMRNLIRSGKTPRPTQTATTQKAWFKRYRDLTS